MHFTTPWYFLTVTMIIPCLWWADRQRKALGHSQISVLDGIKKVPLIGKAPGFCRAAFFTLLVVTLSQPQLIHKVSHMIIQTRDFIITVDTSGSMDAALVDPAQQKFVQAQLATSATIPGTANGSGVSSNSPKPPATTPSAPINAPPNPTTVPTLNPVPNATEPPKAPTRAMAAREGVREFLLHRKDDRVGLITFDDRCYYSEPIGKPISVAKKLDDILRKGGGTNFDGPDSPEGEPGAIACSIKHFVDMHATKTRVFIMVTDGEDKIDPERADELAKEIHDEHIRMYVLGVGEGWNKEETTSLQQFVERPEVAGQVIHVGDAQQMRDAFDRIDKLEKSATEIQVLEHAQELYPYFALAAFIVLLIWIRVAAYVRDQL